MLSILIKKDENLPLNMKTCSYQVSPGWHSSSQEGSLAVSVVVSPALTGGFLDAEICHSLLESKSNQRILPGQTSHLLGVRIGPKTIFSKYDRCDNSIKKGKRF